MVVVIVRKRNEKRIHFKDEVDWSANSYFLYEWGTAGRSKIC